MKSYAQYGEDVIVAEFCARVCPGNQRYIDVGAHHWRELSNTLAFYEQDWSGVLIEPNETFHEGYRVHRPRDVAVLALCGAEASAAPVPFFVNDEQPEMSTMVAGETRRLQALRGYRYRSTTQVVTTLAEIGGQYGNEPAFCSIDVEGAEADVLAGRGDFTPCVFLIESLEHASHREVTGEWAHLLADYDLTTRTELNTIWVRRDLL